MKGSIHFFASFNIKHLHTVNDEYHMNIHFRIFHNGSSPYLWEFFGDSTVAPRQDALVAADGGGGTQLDSIGDVAAKYVEFLLFPVHI